jgi:hypothetical protein
MMIYLEKIRELLYNLKAAVRELWFRCKSRWNNLEALNLGQAIDYFEAGLLAEARQRLNIFVLLWSRNDYGHYLLGLVHILEEHYTKARQQLKLVKNFHQQQAQKLLQLVDKREQIQLLLDSYLESFHLNDLHHVIDELVV